jgi:hypothetical protein
MTAYSGKQGHGRDPESGTGEPASPHGGEFFDLQLLSSGARRHAHHDLEITNIR